MHSEIRFLRVNRYRKPVGSTDTLMGYGVHSALVQRGIAEFVDDKPLVTASISEPVATKPETTSRSRKRRLDSTEESEE